MFDSSAVDIRETIVVFDEDNNDDNGDVIMMPMDENEGLLNWNKEKVYYGGDYSSIGSSNDDDDVSRRSQEFSADDMLTNIITTTTTTSTDDNDDANSFCSCDTYNSDARTTDNNRSSSISPICSSSCFIHPTTFEQEQEFQESLCKLKFIMRESQATRKSLSANTPKLKDYKRSSTVRNVLEKIEHSSHQIIDSLVSFFIVAVKLDDDDDDDSDYDDDEFVFMDKKEH